jgi:hypothetical protein
LTPVVHRIVAQQKTSPENASGFLPLPFSLIHLQCHGELEKEHTKAQDMKSETQPVLMFEMGQEEAECASHIDRIRTCWIRNTEHATQGGFWLPKSPGKFFPDFIVELKDGRIVLVEYKMGKMASDPEEQHKKAVGELWAGRSQGRCRFAWIVDRNWHKLNAELESQAAFE